MWIQPRQTIQGVIERDEIDCAAFSESGCVVKRQVPASPASFSGSPRTLIAHQDLAHQQGADGNEVGAVLKLRAALFLELQIGLMNKRGGLQGMPWTLIADVMTR